jgi:hypothetical protein
VRARVAPALVATIVVMALVSCGDQPRPATIDTPSPEEPTPSLPEGVEISTPASGCGDGPFGTENYSAGPSPVLSDGRGTVPGQANIYGAGREAPPAPGSGGGGVLPPVFPLPSGTSRVVTFPSVTGRVNPIAGGPDNDPNGDLIGATNVKSLQGISGIVAPTNGMFLAGVFLTDAEPTSPAPPRLIFTYSSNEAEFDLAPEIGQVFFIGDGRGRTYAAPDEATRLFLGFADAFGYVGCPGWYGNNAGEAEVEIEVSG